MTAVKLYSILVNIVTPITCQHIYDFNDFDCSKIVNIFNSIL